MVAAKLIFIHCNHTRYVILPTVYHPGDTLYRIYIYILKNSLVVSYSEPNTLSPGVWVYADVHSTVQEDHIYTKYRNTCSPFSTCDTPESSGEQHPEGNLVLNAVAYRTCTEEPGYREQARCQWHHAPSVGVARVYTGSRGIYLFIC